MIRRKYIFIVLIFLGFLLISSCSGGVGAKVPLATSTPTAVPMPTLTPTSTPIQKNFSTIPSKKEIEEQVVVYIVIDDSKSVVDHCEVEAKDTKQKIKEIIETLLYYGSTNGNYAQNISIGFGIISSTNSELFPITAVSELPGENIDVLRTKIDNIDFRNTDVADVKKSVLIAQEAINTYIERNKIVDAKKIIFIITDGVDDIFQDHRYEVFNDKSLNEEYIIYYGLYPYNDDMYDQSEKLLKCHILPELIEKWPEELFAQIWDEESTRVGYVDYFAEKEVNWDVCSINHFYSRSNTNNDRVYLRINESEVNNDELIITKDSHGHVVSQSPFGFYWIDWYMPQYELLFDMESEVIENKNYISARINLDILSDDQNINNIGIGNYSECFNFHFENIQIDNESDISKPGSNQLTFQFDATLPKGTCEKEAIIPFHIESPGGYTYIEDIIAIPLLYKPEIIPPTKIHLLPSKNDQEFYRGIYQINVKTFAYQEPKIYFSKADYKENGTSESSTCDIDLSDEVNGYSSYNVEIGPKLPELYKEQDAVDHAVILNGQNSNSPDDQCVNEIRIQLYSEVIQTEDCGLNELLFVWEAPEDIHSRYILGCSIIPDKNSYSIESCNVVENSMFKEDQDE